MDIETKIIHWDRTHIKQLAKLFCEMWPESILENEVAYLEKRFEKTDDMAFLLKAETNIVGFIYISIRQDYVEGSYISPTPYVEGIYVRDEFQGKGYGRMLMEKGVIWAKEKGFKQMASDTELANQNSIQFHDKMKFRKVNITVNFLRDI